MGLLCNLVVSFVLTPLFNLLPRGRDATAEADFFEEAPVPALAFPAGEQGQGSF